MAIVLLNWNGWRDTIECLESVFRLDYPNWTVIVCDNASTDDSLEHIRAWAHGVEAVTLAGPGELRYLVEPSVVKPVPFDELSRSEAAQRPATFFPRRLVLIRNDENAGFAAGNNVGLAYARRLGIDYVWILNNDTLVAPDALSKLVECARSSDNVGAVGATIYEYGTPNDVQLAAGGNFGPWRSFGTYPKRIGTRPSPAGGREADIDFIAGSSLLLPAATVERVGMIAEQYFMYGEDVDYSLRIRSVGLSLLHAAEAKVWHKGGASIVYRSPRHDYYATRNALHLVAKYHPRMMPVAMAYLTYRVVLPKLIRGQWKRLAVVRRAYRDHASGIFGPVNVDTTGAVRS